MKIKKGTFLKIKHDRKGVFICKAIEDFDSDTVTWIPVVTMDIKRSNIVTTWSEGDEIPCRNDLCEISLYCSNCANLNIASQGKDLICSECYKIIHKG